MSRPLLITLIIALFGVGIFAFTVFHKREKDLITPEDTKKTESQKNTSENTSQQTDTPTTEPEKKNDTENDTTNKEDTAPIISNEKYHITSDDCDNECKGKKNDELLYCKNVCGLSTPSNTSDCTSLTGLNKDYCIKDQAVIKKDASLCNNITDVNVKKLCKNRIQEDILENM